MNLQQYHPTTLVAMIADTSNYLAEQFYVGNVISAQERDALHAEMWRMIDALDAIVGDIDALDAIVCDERDAMLMEAGVDPAVIYEGAPA